MHGWDFYNGDDSVFDTASEDHHGTHVSGTIAAVADNGIGVVGVAPGVRIMPLKFLGGPDGTGSTLDAVDALAYAAAHGARVVNASWSGGGGSTLRNAIANATDIAFVAAAGNSTLDLDSTPTYPAAWAADSAGIDSILSVASVTHSGWSPPSPTSAAPPVDVAAPGSSIYSTLPGNSYGWYSGTSMATPHAAGVAALVASLRPDLSGAELVDAVKAGAQPLASLAGITTTGGLVNAAAAIAPYTTPTDPVAPTLAAPGAPTDVVVTPGDGGSTSAWSAPADDGGSAVTGYTVTAAPAGGPRSR